MLERAKGFESSTPTLARSASAVLRRLCRYCCSRKTAVSRTDAFLPFLSVLGVFNGRGRPEAVEPPRDVVLPPDIPLKQLVGFIEAMHRPIADDFRTGAGLGLMRVESDIALEIVTAAMAEGWTVLPVHDSFITAIDQRDGLKGMMIDCYVRKLGREPSIKG